MATERPLGFFNGLADEPISDEREGEVLGFTKRRWMSDPTIPGAPLDAHHDQRAVGKLLYPFIGESVDAPKREMLAFRGGIYLDDERGRELHRRIVAGDPEVGLSIDYTTHVDVGRQAITGRKLNFVSLHTNPRNRSCRITARQSVDDPTQLTLTLPVQIVPGGDDTKAAKAPLLRFPSASRTMATPAAPPSAASPPSVPSTAPAAAASAAGGAAAAPPTQPPAAAAASTPKSSDAMDIDSEARAVASKVQQMTAEQLRQAAIQSELMQRELTEMRAFKESVEKREQERVKAEQEQRWKQFADSHKDVLMSDLGLNVAEPDKADPSALATLQFMVQDPSASVAGGLLEKSLSALKSEKEKRAALEKQLTDQTAIVETLKKQRSYGPAFGGAQQQQPHQQQQATNATPGAASLALERTKAQLTTNKMPQFPTMIKTSQGLAMMSQVPAIGSQVPAASIVRPLGVVQGADGGAAAPKTGDAIADHLAQMPSDPRISKAHQAIAGLEPGTVRGANGEIYDLRRMYEGQERSPSSRLVFDSDRVALVNAILHSGSGATLPHHTNMLDVQQGHKSLPQSAAVGGGAKRTIA